MSIIRDYSHTPSDSHPVECRYIATMYRGSEHELVQDGWIYCRDRESAQAILTEWNTLSQLHRANMGGDVVWKYTLKGQE